MSVTVSAFFRRRFFLLTFFFVTAVQQLFLEFSDGFMRVRVADDPIDIPSDRDIAAADIADDYAVRGFCQLTGVGAQPVMIFDRGLDANSFGKVYSHGREERARIFQIA